MKKKILTVLAGALLATSMCAVATAADVPTVRVNGYAVEFTDVAPFIDANDRTMMPLRIVGEALGATVDWIDSTGTAVISKNGITVECPIGSTTLNINNNGTWTTLAMDTEAVAIDGSTYLPIRFVAEALEGFVDYSDTYNTVGIYNDVFDGDTIRQLQSYAYTVKTGAFSTYEGGYYDYCVEIGKDDEYMEKMFWDRSGFYNEYGFANAREHLYNNDGRDVTYTFDDIEAWVSGADKFNDCVVREAIAELSYTSDNVEFEFIADTSCIYQSGDSTDQSVVVRGIMKCTVLENLLDWTSEDTDFWAWRLGDIFNYMPQGATVYVPVDVHMSTLVSSTVQCWCVNALDECVVEYVD